MAKKDKLHEHSNHSPRKPIATISRWGIQLLFKGKCVIVFYHAASAVLEIVWYGDIDAHKIKTDGIHLISAIEQEIIAKGYKISKILNVSQKAKGDFSRISKWILDDWFEHLLSFKIKRFSWAYPTDTRARLSSEKSTPSKGEIIRGFPLLADAIHWLNCSEQQRFVSTEANILQALIADELPESRHDSAVNINVNVTFRIEAPGASTINPNDAKIAKLLNCIVRLEVCETIAEFDKKLQKMLDQEIMMLREKLREIGGSGRKITSTLTQNALADYQKFMFKTAQSSRACVRDFARQAMQRACA